MVMFRVAVAVSIHLYELLTISIFGVGGIFGRTCDPGCRSTILGAVSSIWDGNETWLVEPGVVLGARFRSCARPCFRLSTFQFLSCLPA
jgi:cytochrome bd ubiquinol oxidase subunit II